MPGESARRTRTALGTALTAAVAVPVVAGTGGAAISAGGYTFTEVTALGQPAPGGGTFVNDFEPSAINSSGALGFTADVSTGGEGVFIAKGGTDHPGHAQLHARPGRGHDGLRRGSAGWG